MTGAGVQSEPVSARELIVRAAAESLLLNTVLGFGLYYTVTGDDESCVRALSAFKQLASGVVEPVA